MRNIKHTRALQKFPVDRPQLLLFFTAAFVVAVRTFYLGKFVIYIKWKASSNTSPFGILLSNVSVWHDVSTYAGGAHPTTPTTHWFIVCCVGRLSYLHFRIESEQLVLTTCCCLSNPDRLPTVKSHFVSFFYEYLALDLLAPKLGNFQ